MTHVRVALVSPYSYTYPGGVGLHVEALAGELLSLGHEVRLLAPYDPDDRLARVLHRGVSPRQRPVPDHLIPLGRTLGVPIFQEQVMALAMVAAGFSAGEADQLRRAMAAWRRKGGLEAFEAKLIAGMHARGYSDDFARRIVAQIEGFGEYGFPESHAASFALLVYASAWLKCHHPAAFLLGLLNSQPMGFYAPAQIVRDAREHGVEVLPVDAYPQGNLLIGTEETAKAVKKSAVDAVIIGNAS